MKSSAFSSIWCWRCRLLVLGVVLLIAAGSCIAADLMKDGKPGEWCNIENGLPYYFENVGTGPLTITRIESENKFKVQGKAKLLPVGKVYKDEEFTLALDEGSIARSVAAVGKPDWGSLPERELSRAEGHLKFCRAVAQYEAKQHVTEWETLIDGEPARVMYRGTSGGSCGAYGTDLRFELLGDEQKELYQLKPSGRYKVKGTIRVIQTNQTCRNGWIDKDGKVISTEEVEKPEPVETFKGEGADVSFSGVDSGYAKGLLAVASEARRIYAQSYGFDMPEKVTLSISKAQDRPALWTDGNSQMFLKVSNAHLAPPMQSGVFNIYGICHEIGHMAMYRKTSANGLPEGVAQGWAHYAGSVVVDHVYKKLGDSIWPQPYNYSEVEGTARLERQLADPDSEKEPDNRAALVFYKAHKRFGEDKVMGAMKTALEVRPAGKDLMPKFIDELVKLTEDKSAREMFPEEVLILKTTLIKEGKPGEWCRIQHGFPCYFENVGTGPLTVIYINSKNKYKVQGKAKLLPVGKVYKDEEFTLALDEGSIARSVAALGKPDWGSLPANEVREAEEHLKFCRAVAQYEAKEPVTEWETLIDGEPARIMFRGKLGGSCGAYGTDLRFELPRDEYKELYQLKPSGRFKVNGTIKVIQTNQNCTNGFIDKDGKVISTEK